MTCSSTAAVAAAQGIRNANHIIMLLAFEHSFHLSFGRKLEPAVGQSFLTTGITTSVIINQRCAYHQVTVCTCTRSNT